jgi:hypothetical protein
MGKKPTDTLREPWERQENESVQAFEAFQLYRDMGTERSLIKVEQKLDKSHNLIGRWSKNHKWVARVEAWTDEQDRITRENLSKGVTAMRKNHTDIATAMLVKALKALQKLPVEEMTPADVAKLVDVASKLERISRGEATEKTESKTELAGGLTVNEVDLSSLSDDELAALDEITGKISTG